MSGAGLWERTQILVGEDGVAALLESRVLLCGLGGVGSFAAEALGRAGIGHITLVDHDVVSPSNLNRQLPATLETVGRKKVAVMGERLATIHPACQLDLRDLFLTPDIIPGLLREVQPHAVVDAIDTLNCKVALLVACRTMEVPVVSSMGAGGRLDPSQVVVGDLMDSHTCHLARFVRSRVRRQGVERGIVAVWSREPALPHACLEPTGDGRSRAVNGTISYMPALFGLHVASVVIRQILMNHGGRGGSPPRVIPPQSYSS